MKREGGAVNTGESEDSLKNPCWGLLSPELLRCVRRGFAVVIMGLEKDRRVSVGRRKKGRVLCKVNTAALCLELVEGVYALMENGETEGGD